MYNTSFSHINIGNPKAKREKKLSAPSRNQPGRPNKQKVVDYSAEKVIGSNEKKEEEVEKDEEQPIQTRSSSRVSKPPTTFLDEANAKIESKQTAVGGEVEEGKYTFCLCIVHYSSIPLSLYSSSIYSKDYPTWRRIPMALIGIKIWTINFVNLKPVRLNILVVKDQGGVILREERTGRRLPRVSLARVPGNVNNGK